LTLGKIQAFFPSAPATSRIAVATCQENKQTWGTPNKTCLSHPTRPGLAEFPSHQVTQISVTQAMPGLPLVRLLRDRPAKQMGPLLKVKSWLEFLEPLVWWSCLFGWAFSIKNYALDLMDV
jgi:hypothetical protein